MGVEQNQYKKIHPAMDMMPPWAMNPTSAHSGWQVKTEIMKSAVPGGGSGRYMKESVKKGTSVRINKIVEYRSGDPSDYFIPGNIVVTDNVDDMMRAFEKFHDVPGLASNMEQINNFAHTPHNVERGINKKCYHFVPCNYFNHASEASEEANVTVFAPEDKPDEVHVVALRDIEKGEELFQDYRTFAMPTWYNEWTKQHEYTTTEQLGFAISGKN